MSFFSSHKHMAAMPTSRLETFSDGVFAIAITLLILNIGIPRLSPQEVQDGALVRAVFDLWPQVLSFIVSFLVIAVYWVSHHLLLYYIKKADRIFIWINTLFLLVIAFMPFPTALISQYGRQPIAVAIYGLTLCMASMFFLILWKYASRGHRLIEKDMDTALIRFADRFISIGFIFYLLAFAASFVYPTLSIFMYVLVPLFYVFPNPLDEEMRKDEQRKAAGNS